MKIRRTTMVITQRCTLKCKMCLAFIPYFENPVHTLFEEAEVIIDNYFKLVDNVEIFSVTGGEPLLNPDLNRIMNKVLEYRDSVAGTIDIVTNGTLIFPEELLETLEKNRDKMRVIISNYGKNLSRNIQEIEESLQERNVNYRIQNYDIEADEWTYDGWVDFSDHSLKHDTEEKLIKQAKRCIFRQGHYYVINDGELHPCSRQYWRMRKGIISKDENWYIDLNRKDMNLEKETAKLQGLEETPYLLSCAHCNGVHAGVKRHKPAEQL